MKLSDNRSSQYSPMDPPSPERRERETFFQMNEITLNRKKSSRQSPSKVPEISRKMFNVLYPIGKGGFGKVWKVESKKSRAVYAMK